MKGAPLILLALLGSCAHRAVPADPGEAFFTRVAALCGKAFEGRIASPPSEADASFAGKRLVMDVRDCSHDAIRIPFHVGEDRSRTWVLTRTRPGVRLKHDHRHEDGSEDRLTQYGGDSEQTVLTVAGLARAEFPADTFSKEMFVRENIPASVANVWAMDVHPGRAFAYELRRPGRFFRVEFDLTRPVAPPPPPWGAR